MIPLAEALAAFWTARRLSRPGLGRARFEAAQAKALQDWLTRDLPRVAAYPRALRDLQDLPILDKARLMANFADYNQPRISADAVTAALQGNARVGDYTVGASTGTSGNRGYFVISEAERYRWLGAILAKTMADMLWQRQRVAILLPQDTRLYGSAKAVPRLQLRFYSLTEGVDHLRQVLEQYAPTVIVAPPKVLRHMAEAKFRLSPQRIFSAAETLDPVDRPIIETCFRLRLDQIYMATEGLLAVTCRAGSLHLAEDSIFFEFEPVGDGLVSPLISCFRRQTQIMARYRMNDLLRLSDRHCSCGSPLRVVDEVVGRMDDCFRLVGPSGPVLVTPDILRNAVLRADQGITDFRVLQLAPGRVELVLPPDLADASADTATSALATALKACGASAEVMLRRAALPVDFSRKLRRVECRLPRLDAR